MEDEVKAELLSKMERKAALLPTPARHDPSTLRGIAYDVTAPFFDHAYSIHRHNHASLTDEFLEKLRTCASAHRRDTRREEYRLYLNQWTIRLCGLSIFIFGLTYISGAWNPDLREWRLGVSAGTTLLLAAMFVCANGWSTRWFLDGNTTRFSTGADYPIFGFTPMVFASAEEELIHRIERRLSTLDSKATDLRELENVVREEIEAFPNQSSLPEYLHAHLTDRAVAEIQSPRSFARRTALHKEYQCVRLLLFALRLQWCLVLLIGFPLAFYHLPSSHERILLLLVTPVCLYLVSSFLRYSPSELFRGVQTDLLESDLIWIENIFRTMLVRFSAKRTKSQARSKANAHAEDSCDGSHC